MIKHILLYKFKENASPEAIKALADQFLECKARLPVLRKVEHGPNAAEKKDLGRGFNYCFLLTFEDMAGVHQYIRSEQHDRIVNSEKPISEGLLVFDLEVKE
jgi:hypothetical protein